MHIRHAKNNPAEACFFLQVYWRIQIISLFLGSGIYKNMLDIVAVAVSTAPGFSAIRTV